MADPLTIGTGVIAVLTGAAATSKALYNLWQSFESLKDDLEAFSGQIRRLEERMVLLHGRLEEIHRSGIKISGIDVYIDGLQRDCRTKADVLERTRERYGDVRLLDKLKYLIKKNTVKDTSEALSGFVEMLKDADDLLTQ